MEGEMKGIDKVEESVDGGHHAVMFNDEKRCERRTTQARLRLTNLPTVVGSHSGEWLRFSKHCF